MEKPIRRWRCSYSMAPEGVSVWFDPTTELLTLRDLTEDEKLTNLDKRRSVSGSIRSDQAEEIDGCEGPGGSLQGSFFHVKGEGYCG